MNRKDFLKKTGVGVLGATLLSHSVSGCKDYKRADYEEKSVGWQNWSGLQSCNPSGIETPTNEDQLASVMKKSKGVRFVGSGHSFMPLVPTNDTIISLDAFSGVISTDSNNLTAHVRAGSKLAYLSREFDKKGQAFMNLPDINTQSLAGAIGTGTHGTGNKFQAIHANILYFKLLTPNGEVLECNAGKNPEIFHAGKVSLGLLGAITEIKLQNRKSYALHRKVSFQTLDYVLKNATELFEKHEHFEAYYISHTKMCIIIVHDIHEGPLKPRESTEDEDGLETLKLLRDYFSWSPPIRKLVAGLFMRDGLVTEDYSDDSWRLLSQARVSRFNESEFHLPKENGLECFKKVCEKIDSIKESFYPIELRSIKGDDAWLSPFYNRDSISVAVHADNKEAYEYLISDFGQIFKSYGGRPHWGKLNDLSQKELLAIYPKFKDFLSVRRHCDPEGKLLNDYLKSRFS